MADRVVLHCDLNNFFASVTLLSNATLYNMPVAVCGNEKERHGIVLAKNEIAKSYGVKTAETVRDAKRKCPELVCLPPDYKQYKKYSAAARKIYERYTDMIEPFGIDECWLDVTGSIRIFGSGEEIAEKIRCSIKNELKITVSIGVSFNKAFAKLGSDMKKPDGITVISKENFKSKVWPLPAKDLLYVGRSTDERLKSSGIFTIGDVANCDTALLSHLLGKNGEQLKRYAMGLDSSPVADSNALRIPKSIGRSVTLDHDIDSYEEVRKIFLVLSEEITEKMRNLKLAAFGFQIHLRDSSLRVKEYSATLSAPITSALQLSKKGFELFKRNYSFLTPLRSVGIRAINLKDKDTYFQQSFFDLQSESENEEKIEQSLMDLRNKFGESSVKRASTIEKQK